MKLFRFFTFDRSQANSEKRTVPVAFSSEHPVDRGDYEEILDHVRGNVDLTRLNDSHPLLLNHDPEKQIGVVESAEVDEGEKKCRALIRFGKSDLANEIFQDVQDGIRKHMSVGYERLKEIAREKTQDGKTVARFAWRPFELSIVPVPADPTVGVGRSAGETRTMTSEGCGCTCRVALSACNKALTEIESCASEADALHKAAAEQARDVIAALAITAEDVQFWSEATSAQCVAVCAECATACDLAVKALRSVSACAHCGSEANAAIEEIEEAAEACRENAGVPVKDAAVAKEAEVEAVACEGVEVKSEIKPEETAAAVEAGKTEIETRQTVDSGTLTKAENAEKHITMSEQAIKDPVELERSRVKAIRTAADEVTKNFPEGKDKFRSLADTAIDAGSKPEDFNVELLKTLPGVRKAVQIETPESMGIDGDSAAKYSIVRAVQDCIKNNRPVPSGYEGEVHQEMVKRMRASGGTVAPNGFWLPPWVKVANPRASARRDLNVTTFGQGGAFVQTSILTPIIGVLRNRMVCFRLGVQSMAGLEGNVAIPRQTGAATAYSVAESAALTKSTQAIDQVLLTPKRVGAWTEYSKQLLIQSSVDVENFIRDDLMKQLAIKWDYLILNGAGANSEPTGVANVNGIGSVTFGTTATYAKAVSFETALASANADLGKMAFVTTPATRGAWKLIPKVASSTFPIFVWEKGEWGDGSNDGEVNAYRAAATNQVPGNIVFFGNWEDAIHALWGGMDVVVNPYSRDTEAVVRITVNTFGDVAVRHAASFCVSSDSGAQ